MEGNTGRVIEVLADARDRLHADLVMFPELALCGYPPEDLLFHAGLRRQVARSLERIREASRGISVLVGFPDYVDQGIYNGAAVFRDGQECARYHKHLLPNYQVFDEKRYFKPGDASYNFV